MYTKRNVTVSMMKQLAQKLNDAGYDVKWQETQEIQPQSALPEALATVTLLEGFPAKQESIQRLNIGSPTLDDVVYVPFLCYEIFGAPRKGPFYQMGDTKHWRDLSFSIDGVAKDSWQQDHLARVLTEWLDDDAAVISVWDYLDEDNPVALEDAWIGACAIETPDLEHLELEAIRYYIKMSATLEYIE